MYINHLTKLQLLNKTKQYLSSKIDDLLYTGALQCVVGPLKASCQRWGVCGGGAIDDSAIKKRTFQTVVALAVIPSSAT